MTDFSVAGAFQGSSSAVSLCRAGAQPEVPVRFGAVRGRSSPGLESPGGLQTDNNPAGCLGRTFLSPFSGAVFVLHLWNSWSAGATAAARPACPQRVPFSVSLLCFCVASLRTCQPLSRDSVSRLVYQR